MIGVRLWKYFLGLPGGSSHIAPLWQSFVKAIRVGQNPKFACLLCWKRLYLNNRLRRPESPRCFKNHHMNYTIFKEEHLAFRFQILICSALKCDREWRDSGSKSNKSTGWAKPIKIGDSFMAADWRHKLFTPFLRKCTVDKILAVSRFVFHLLAALKNCQKFYSTILLTVFFNLLTWGLENVNGLLEQQVGWAFLESFVFQFWVTIL